MARHPGGNWITAGSFTEAGSRPRAGDPVGPLQSGHTSLMGCSGPRIAACSPTARRATRRQALDAIVRKTSLVENEGHKNGGHRRPYIKFDSNTQGSYWPFIMNPEGVGRIFAPLELLLWTFPRAHEPIVKCRLTPASIPPKRTILLVSATTHDDKYANAKGSGYTVVGTPIADISFSLLDKKHP